MKDLFFFIIGFILGAFLFTCNLGQSMHGATEQVVPSDWVNNAGDIVSSLTGSPEAFAYDRAHLVDSLANVYKTKPKSVIEYVVMNTSTDTDLKPEGPGSSDYFSPDTASSCPPPVKNMRQRFSSPYYTANVQLGDSSYMHLQSYDTVTVLWKRLKKGVIQLDVSTANPDTKVYGLKAFRIAEKKTKWAIGLQAGYGFYFTGNNIKRSPYLGIGITKALVKF